jgi:hypothetical protein
VIFLIVIVAIGLYFTRNILVERGVEAGGDYALKVKTDLGSAGLSLGAGSLELNDYKIGNPEGFEAEDFLTIDHGLIDVKTGSLLGDEVLIDSLILENVEINFEQIDTRGNYLVILDNIKKLDMESSPDNKQKFRINRAAIRNIRVNAVLTLLGNQHYDQTFAVDNISLQNIGSDNGATLAQVTGRIIKVLIAKAVTTGKGILPGGLGENLNQFKDTAVEKAKEEAKDKLKDIGGSLLGGDK